jgi:hypothetical protein
MPSTALGEKIRRYVLTAVLNMGVFSSLCGLMD